MWCISFDSHCHKCGQTTCPVEKDAIQTNCYCEARPSYFAAVLDLIESVCTSFTFVWNIDIFYLVSAISIFLCLAVSTSCYGKILLSLASHQANMRGYAYQANNTKSASLNIMRCKKTLSTALWIHFTLFVCFLPLVIILSCNNLLSVERTPLLLILDMAKATLRYLNSLLNPILYCWKIREIRQAVKKILQKTSC